MDPEIRERLLERLAALLWRYPAGIKEYELVQVLKREKIVFFDHQSLSDPLDLFHVHFLLFHLLYLLRTRLWEQKLGALEIHCLKIRITPFLSAPLEDAVIPLDPLQGYYLDWHHMETTTRADVAAMIESFWQRLASDEKRGEALSVLGLPNTADTTAIRSRYRQLAKEHHPDAGGDGGVFIKIADAAEILLKYSV
ncbi:MAG: DnaJ domain-containing protein [Magnetococcales bacterium]|nr:DnaJ domain-containing protein [Magnetococcales bacterium]